MNFKPMQSVPKSRSEFERNVNIFTHLLEDGKVKMVQNTGTEQLIPSLTKLRVLPNERVNFLTIDESARLTINSYANFQDKDNMDCP